MTNLMFELTFIQRKSRFQVDIQYHESYSLKVQTHVSQTEHEIE